MLYITYLSDKAETNIVTTKAQAAKTLNISIYTIELMVKTDNHTTKHGNNLYWCESITKCPSRVKNGLLAARNLFK
jgi:hypothetical protein